MLNLQNFAPNLMGFFFWIQKEGEKNGGDNKVVPVEKKDDISITAIYKIYLHCEHCAKRVERAVRRFDGKIHIQIHQPTSLYFPNCILLLFV